MAHRQVGVNGKKFLLLSTQYFNDLLRRAKLSDSTQLRKTLNLDEQREQIANRTTTEKPPYRKRKHLEKKTADFLREKDRAVDLAPKHHGYVKKGRIGVIFDRKNDDMMQPPHTPPLGVPPRTHISPASDPSTIHRPTSSMASPDPEESLYEDAFQTTRHMDPDDTEALSTISAPQSRLIPAPSLAGVSSSTSTTTLPIQPEREDVDRRPSLKDDGTEDPLKPQFSIHNVVQRLVKNKGLGKGKTKAVASFLQRAKGDSKLTDWNEDTGQLKHQSGNIEKILETLYEKTTRMPNWAEGTDMFLKRMTTDPSFKYLSFNDVPNLFAWKYYQDHQGATSTTRGATTVGKGNGQIQGKRVRWKGLSRVG